MFNVIRHLAVNIINTVSICLHKLIECLKILRLDYFKIL